MNAFALRGLAVLALTFAACGAAVDLSATSGDQQTAVKQTIERSNRAQAEAFNTKDEAAMKAYATDSFYQQLVRTNQDLRSSGVTRIELVTTEYRGLSVDGSNAKATTLETWRSTYQDGSADETTARNDYTLVLDGSAWKVASDDQPAAAARPAGIRPSTDTGTPTAARTVSTSSNWSGYAASGGSFTSVTGTWTVPNVTATAAGADATWVGIGGIDSRDLIQAGTQATASGGLVRYDAWIEMLPASSRPVNLAVSAGDSVTVTITEQNAGLWTIAIANDTTGGRYATTVRYDSAKASAEWIEEAPSVGRGTLALDEFGSVRFSGASAVRDGRARDLTELGAEAITMINGARQVLAQPSVVGADGASFTVTRTAAQSTGGTGGDGRRRRAG